MIGLTGGVIGVIVAWVMEAVANRLAYRFILKPQGASFVDFFSLPFWLAGERDPFCAGRFNSGRALSSRTGGADRSGQGAAARLINRSILLRLLAGQSL